MGGFVDLEKRQYIKPRKPKEKKPKRPILLSLGNTTRSDDERQTGHYNPKAKTCRCVETNNCQEGVCRRKRRVSFDDSVDRKAVSSIRIPLTPGDVLHHYEFPQVPYGLQGIGHSNQDHHPIPVREDFLGTAHNHNPTAVSYPPAAQPTYPPAVYPTHVQAAHHFIPRATYPTDHYTTVGRPPNTYPLQETYGYNTHRNSPEDNGNIRLGHNSPPRGRSDSTGSSRSYNSSTAGQYGSSLDEVPDNRYKSTDRNRSRNRSRGPSSPLEDPGSRSPRSRSYTRERPRHRHRVDDRRTDYNQHDTSYTYPATGCHRATSIGNSDLGYNRLSLRTGHNVEVEVYRNSRGKAIDVVKREPKGRDIVYPRSYENKYPTSPPSSQR